MGGAFFGRGGRSYRKASPVLRVLANVFGGKVAVIQARSPELAGSNGVGDEEEKDEGESLRR